MKGVRRREQGLRKKRSSKQEKCLTRVKLLMKKLETGYDIEEDVNALLGGEELSEEFRERLNSSLNRP